MASEQEPGTGTRSNVTPIAPQVVTTSYDEVAATPVPGKVLSEIVDASDRTTEATLQTLVLGGGRRKTARDEGEVIAQAEKAAMKRARGPHTRPQVSQQIVDLWDRLGGVGLMRYPVYDPMYLASLPQYSTILPQCLNSLTVNVHGFGFDWDPRFNPEDVDEGSELETEIALWKNEGDNFFHFASLDYAFSTLVQRTAIDRFTVGYSGWELLRDRNTTVLVGLEHVPAVTLRLGFRDVAPTLVTRKVLSLDGARWVKTSAWKRLGRYLQIEGNQLVFFKEVGDPRLISRLTGEIIKPRMEPEDYGNPLSARELLWFGGYNPADPYGYPLPIWIGALIALAGERSSDEVNLGYFKNKSVPPLALLVSGGVVTEESMDRIDEKMEELKGVDNFHKILAINAVHQGAMGDQRDLMDPGASTTPKIELVPLTSAQQKDALFQAYRKNMRDSVRSACGVPPIAIGESTDYNRATAQVAMEMAERGVFAPLRNEFDDRINRFILPELGVKHWRFRSNTPDLTNVEDAVRAIEAGVKAGVGSPNVYAQVLARILKTDIPPNPEEWANFPVNLVEIAMQTGLVGLDLTGDGVALNVNESQRERFQEMVGECIVDALDQALVLAREQALSA